MTQPTSRRLVTEAKLATDLAAKADTTALAGYATDAELSDGLATKVNASTYTAGLAAKQDAATLAADTATHVTDGSALDVALRAASDAASKAVLARRGIVKPTVVPSPRQVAPYMAAHMTVAPSLSLPAAGGGRMNRFVAPYDTEIVGIVYRVAANPAGNLEVAVYDEHFTKIGGSGSFPTPQPGAGKVTTFATAIPLRAGRSYWMLISGDSASPYLGGWDAYDMGAHNLATLINSGAYPAPAVLHPQALGLGFGAGQVSGFSWAPLLSPAVTARATYTTMATPVGVEIVGADRASGRLFAKFASGHGYSDDGGNTWTTIPVPDAAFPACKAVAMAGDHLLLAYGDTAGDYGQVWRHPRTGPYNAGTKVINGQEGHCLPWNLVMYDDGLAFAGNYDGSLQGAAGVRVRRSTDFGATWTVVMDLGAGDSITKHVHTVLRSAGDPSNVFVNVGDSGPNGGVWESTDGGLTFTYNGTFGDIRLTPACALPDGRIVWGSDQVNIAGGANLFVQNPADDTLKPYGQADPPYHGDVYGLSRDDDGLIWYFTQGGGSGAIIRGGLFVSPDDGKTGYFVDDLGPSSTYVAVERVGERLFLGDRRYDISAILPELLAERG